VTWLVVIILAVLVVALYPVVRDFLRQRRRTQPAYVEGLQHALDNRPDAAIKSLKEAVEADTENVDAYIRLGDIFMSRGDVERALRIHENLALRRNLKPPDERKVYAALARDYLRTERRVKAIAMLEELARVDKSDWEARERLAELYVDTASWEKADELLKEFRRNPALRARAARLLVRLGRARVANDAAAAQAAFEEALRLDPQSVEARLALGDHQLNQGDTDAAIRTWSEVINAAPERNGLVRDRLERAYFDIGRYEDVTQLYERLLRRVPDDTGLAVALAGIYRKKGDLAAAIRLLEKLGDSETVPGLVLALAHLEQGDANRARALLESALARLRVVREK
jgi:lipopolysaccharide biosynthesis regulator YciM